MVRPPPMDESVESADAAPCLSPAVRAMTTLTYAVSAGLILAIVACAPVITTSKPILIAHRGASGLRPEHTLESYRLAVEQGADYVEPDLVLTRDGVLVARHENEIGGTTDVASRPEFAARRRTQIIDGETFTGWFTEDFTLAELRTLRARERLPELRPANTRFDGRFQVPTFEEVLTLIDELNATRPGLPPIGVYPETKHPAHFQRIGLSFDEPLLAALAKHGYTERSSPVFIQSFEAQNLRRMRSRTPVRFTRLLGDEPGTPDLADIATYADVVGVPKDRVIPRDAHERLATPTTLVADAHAAGLAVHVYTFRAENAFLPTECRRGSDRAALGDLKCELWRYLDAGIDGFFSDHTLEAAAVRDARPR